ncbi:MAG: hypothetical protein J6B20_02195 [Clostridia bacterium]|nr:hypothetical protein [Clostridia bacterium]
MKDKKSVVACSQKEVDRVVNICNNIFYSDYLNTGILKSNHEIEARIKSEVCESLIDFYGEAYKKKIIKIIDKIQIKFVYQTFGPLCSVSDFIENLECNSTEKFVEKYGSISEFDYLFNLLNHANEKSMPICEVVKDNYKLVADCYQVLVNNAKSVGLKSSKILENDLMTIVNDKNLFNQFLDLIKQYYNIINSKERKLHDNPQVNKNLLFVSNYVEKTKSDIENICLQHHKRFKQITQSSSTGIALDPLVKTLHPECFSEHKNANKNIDKAFTSTFLENMLRVSLANGGYTCGYYDEEKVFFASGLTDDTIIHELIHAVEQGGFLKDDKVGLTEKYDKYEMFNEVVTEYFATLISKERIIKNKQNIVSQNDTESPYRVYFNMMEGLLSAYLPELKATRMGDNPVENFQQIIGEVAFERIALLCNRYAKMIQNKNICNQADEMCMSVSEYLHETNQKLNGSIDTSDIEHLQKLLDIELKRIDVELTSLCNRLAVEKLSTKKQVLASDFDSTLLKKERTEELVPVDLVTMR